jgi:glutamine synthetase
MTDPTAPSSLPSEAALPDEVRWVRLSFVDVVGTTNSLTIPAERVDEARSPGIVFDGSALAGPARQIESDMRLRIDADAPVLVEGREARVIATVVRSNGTPWFGDPRDALRRALDELGGLADAYSIRSELEFYLVDGESPVDTLGYFDDAVGPGMEVAQLAVDRLRGLGYEAVSCHHEVGPGQYEIDFAAMDALTAADSLVVAKDVIGRAAEAAGLAAVFMARPRSGWPGSGMHLHQRAGDLLVVDGGMLTDAGRSFVAGQLDMAAALCALAAPTINSYRRLHAEPEAPSGVSWGHSNRAALIRVSRELGSLSSIEYRGADPMANPYLLFAALLAAGLSGVDESLSLGPPEDETDVGLAEAVRYAPLPRNLDEALDALSAADVVVDALGSTLVNRFITVGRGELESFRAHVTTWEIERYDRRP